LTGQGFWVCSCGARKDLGERARVREESRKPGGAWPPQTGVRPIRQENKLLIATAPVR
jgi:hypothetical protein